MHNAVLFRNPESAEFALTAGSSAANRLPALPILFAKKADNTAVSCRLKLGGAFRVACGAPARTL